MEQFGELMGYIYEFFKCEYIIYGHPISMWQIYVFTIAGTLIMEFIGGMLSGD